MPNMTPVTTLATDRTLPTIELLGSGALVESFEGVTMLDQVRFSW
jgi:hypothetical protein